MYIGYFVQRFRSKRKCCSLPPRHFHLHCSIPVNIELVLTYLTLSDSALLGYSAHTGHVRPEGLRKARRGMHAQLTLETVAHLRGVARTQKGGLV